MEDFEDCVIIETNPLNPGYKYINPAPSNEAYNPEMLREVLADQMSTILTTIKTQCTKNDWNSIINGNAAPYSVGDVVLSLMRQGVDLTSPATCAETIRQYIMKEKLER
jgi:hypothetical protein